MKKLLSFVIIVIAFFQISSILAESNEMLDPALSKLSQIELFSQNMILLFSQNAKKLELVAVIHVKEDGTKDVPITGIAELIIPPQSGPVFGTIHFTSPSDSVTELQNGLKLGKEISGGFSNYMPVKYFPPEMGIKEPVKIWCSLKGEMASWGITGKIKITFPKPVPNPILEYLVLNGEFTAKYLP